MKVIDISRIILSMGLVIVAILWALNDFPLPGFINDIWGLCCVSLVIILIIIIIIPTEKNLFEVTFR